MLKTLRKQWHDLASAQPGHRFQSHYRREHQKSGGSNRPWKLIVGIALIVVGLVLMFLPGPGVVFLALGGAFLAGESQVVARALDRFELYARRLFAKIKKQWQHFSLPAKVVAAIVLIAIVSAAVWFVYSRYRSIVAALPPTMRSISLNAYQGLSQETQMWMTQRRVRLRNIPPDN